jgi:hypothetical protein
MVRVRILSLGEIVTQNQMKMMMELARLINSADPTAAMSQLKDILQNTETQHSLDQFRLGFKREEEIIIEMISKIRESTGKQLSIDEFNMAWNAMNPTFSEFASVLSEIVREHHDDHKMVFVSYTNPKDMRHLTTELDSNSVPYTRDKASGEINSICGIPLYLTYLAKKSKADLILQVIHQQTASRSFSNRGDSFFEQEPASPSEAPDIKYIRCIRSTDDPIYRLLSDKSTAEVNNTTVSAGVKTILWNKQDKQPFSKVIHDAAICILPASKL